MAQQTVDILQDNGSKAYRVKDALTPLNGTGAPAVNAKFFGQLYVNEGVAVYAAVAVGSATPADDWKQISNAS